jgi:BCD family chlorophyll transporter-like MFS transporter
MNTCAISGTGSRGSLGWGSIVRLGLVQAAIGALVVLATSTMNRVMVVELAMPAVLPGLLVALHYMVQMTRARFGHGSDMGGRLTRWIIGGMVVLAVGGIAAAASVALMSVDHAAGIAAAIVSFLVIGLGVGASGTSLLVLLAKSVSAERRPAAATITWLMMFVGFVVTTAVAGQLLEPYSHARLIALTAGVALVAMTVTVLAVGDIEQRVASVSSAGPVGPDAGAGGVAPAPQRARFREALAQVWSEPAARRFTIFVFVSMLAYSGQELIFEPFAGLVFQLSPAHSARLASLQHGGALAGMLLVAALGSLPGRWRVSSLRGWTVGGCVASAAALLALVAAGLAPGDWPLRCNVFCLGLANGVFAVAAIGSMMSLVSAGGVERQGIRMGLWGGSQAVAFALGGVVSSGAADLARHLLGTPRAAYALVFLAQAGLFLAASGLALSIGAVSMRRPAMGSPAGSTQIASTSALHARGVLKV